MSTFVKGRCPLCHSGVFVASGGWLTCSGSDCPDPTFVSEIFAKYEESNKNLGEQLSALRAALAIYDYITALLDSLADKGE